MYTWPDGTEFDGYFENDKKEGFGTFTFPSGNKFEVCTINQSINQSITCKLAKLTRVHKFFSPSLMVRLLFSIIDQYDKYICDYNQS